MEKYSDPEDARIVSRKNREKLHDDYKRQLLEVFLGASEYAVVGKEVKMVVDFNFIQNILEG